MKSGNGKKMKKKKKKLDLRPFSVKVCPDISIEQKQDNEERFDTEAKSKRVSAEKALEEHSCLANNELKEMFGSSNRVNKKDSTTNLLLPLKYHSSCELLTLSLKHMLKVFLTTLPIIIVVCLTGFCLSKLPYTNDCEKYPKNLGCTYFNENLVFGVNSIARLVSTWGSYIFLVSLYINCNKGGNSLTVINVVIGGKKGGFCHTKFPNQRCFRQFSFYIRHCTIFELEFLERMLKQGSQVS